MRCRIFVLTIALIGLPFTMANASGIPAAGLMTDPDSPLLVVIKFGADFTQQDAETNAQLISQALGLAGQYTTVTQGFMFFSPATLAQMGMTDADALKDLLRAPAEQLGYLFIFLDISKKPSAGGTQYGLSHKVDVWIANDRTVSQFAHALGLTGAFLYAATLEYPEMYPQLLTQMLSSL
jgi:hypothetical protein